VILKKLSSGAALDDLVIVEIKDSDELKLGQKPFPVNLIDFENKKVLMRAHQRESAKGKKMLLLMMSIEPRS
jgi:hypothetical protein